MVNVELTYVIEAKKSLRKEFALLVVLIQNLQLIKSLVKYLNVLKE